MKKFFTKNERGLTLVEAIIGIAIIAIMSAVIAPKAIEATGKSKSNSLQEEFTTVVSAFTTLDTSGKSAVHAVKTNIKDASGTMIMADYIIPVSPSTAFGTVTKSEVFRRTSGGVKPLELSYGFNTITLTSANGYTGSYKHTGDLEGVAKDFNGTTGAPLNATNLSSQGATGISPIFSINETKLLEDFVKSPNGLNWGEELQSITGKDDLAGLLAFVFGGPSTNTDVSYFPYEASAGADIVVKAPIQLTIVDTDTIESSSSGTSLSTITDTSKGTLYQVTSLMSRQEFITAATAATTLFDASNTDLLNTLYDRISEGFLVGNPVFIPHRAKDIIKSTASDLHYGFYRP